MTVFSLKETSLWQIVSDPWLIRVEWMPVSSYSQEMLCSNQLLPKSHRHLFCLYIHCYGFWSPRSGVECYNLSYLQCCCWACQGILWCFTALNFRGSKYKIPLDTIKTSSFNNAKLVFSLDDSLCVGIASPSFSEVAYLILLSILLQKGRNKSMTVSPCPCCFDSPKKYEDRSKNVSSRSSLCKREQP